jgi:Alpha/beta hydrolase domain
VVATGIEISESEVLRGGASFGDAGPYERLRGTVQFAVRADRSANADITDIELAADVGGLVRFECDVELLRPVDEHRGNRKLVVDVPNRGRPIASWLNLVDSSGEPLDPTADFFMERGYTVLACGWQQGTPMVGGLEVRVPDAKIGGSPVRGPVMCDFQVSEKTGSIQLPAGSPLVANGGGRPEEATLTARDHLAAPRREISRDRWRFERREGAGDGGADTVVTLDGGFEPGPIYDLVYTAEGAPIVGLGLLAVRDLVSWLRSAPESAGNPSAGTIDTVFAVGLSQSGHFLRHFLYLGMNLDEEQRAVFDGVLIVIAGARRGEFNLRFGQPSKTLGDYVGALFPFSDDEQRDPVTAQTDGQFARLERSGAMPRVITLDSAAEYWVRNSSLLHISADGTVDLPLSSSHRLYHMAGTQHGRGSLPPAANWVGTPIHHPLNSLDFTPLLRSAMVNLEAWACEGVEPPESCHPRLDDTTAVTPEQVLRLFVDIPGVRPPLHLHYQARLDFGPDIDRGIATQLPPGAGEPYQHHVSAVDSDGNEIAGVRLPDVSVPLASYTGWNVRHVDAGAPGEIILRAGSTLPFPWTRQQRDDSGDPRAAVAERYRSRADYLDQVRVAALGLVERRLLLLGDVEPIVDRGARRWDLMASVDGGETPGSGVE